MTETWRHELKPFEIDVISIQWVHIKRTSVDPIENSINQGTVHPLYTIMADNMQTWYDKCVEKYITISFGDEPNDNTGKKKAIRNWSLNWFTRLFWVYSPSV